MHATGEAELNSLSVDSYEPLDLGGRYLNFTNAVPDFFQDAVQARQRRRLIRPAERLAKSNFEFSEITELVVQVRHALIVTMLQTRSYPTYRSNYCATMQ